MKQTDKKRVNWRSGAVGNEAAVGVLAERLEVIEIMSDI